MCPPFADSSAILSFCSNSENMTTKSVAKRRRIRTAIQGIKSFNFHTFINTNFVCGIISVTLSKTVLTENIHDYYYLIIRAYLLRYLDKPINSDHLHCDALETTCLMANCEDPDQMIHFRNYIICVHTVYSHVNMHTVHTWSNQHLVKSGKPASKTTG